MNEVVMEGGLVDQSITLEDAYLLFDLNISFARSISQWDRLGWPVIISSPRGGPLRYPDRSEKTSWYGVSRESSVREGIRG
jgi:hypothetical protein